MLSEAQELPFADHSRVANLLIATYPLYLYNCALTKWSCILPLRLFFADRHYAKLLQKSDRPETFFPDGFGAQSLLIFVLCGLLSVVSFFFLLGFPSYFS